MAKRLAVVTGVTGFVAKHVALRFLQAGWEVRGTLRAPGREAEVRAALAPHLNDKALSWLSFSTADLTRDHGWPEAMTGAEAVIHTASPFPMAQPRQPEDLITPAVDGTRRVLTAAHAAGVRRAVVTSSTVAVLNEYRRGVQDESDWCDLKAPGTTAYAMSKTLAERAAWDFAAAHPEMALTCINPGLVLGPPLDAQFGTSLKIVQRVLRGRDPMLPMLCFVCVDARDVAEMHLRAVLHPETAGKRYLAAAGSMTMPDMGLVLKSAYPHRRIPTRVAPMPLLRVLSLFDAGLRSILPSVGQLVEVSNARARHEMGMRFIEPADALRASADWLIANKLV